MAKHEAAISVNATEEDYHSIKAWLPEQVSAWLDIGCGHPVIDWWIAKHYGGADLDIHLLDGDETIPRAERQTGWNLRTKPWKSRLPGVAWLRGEYPNCRVHGHPADAKLTIPCDLIISRYSWGHHYPIVTYMKLASRSLRRGGRIITDLRFGRNGMETFEAFGFRRIANIREPSIRHGFKSGRIVVERA